MNPVIDFVIAAWREDGVWLANRIPKRSATSLDALVTALGAHPSDVGTIGMVSIDDDVLLLVRAMGSQTSLVLTHADVELQLVDDALDLVGDDDSDSGYFGSANLLEDVGIPALDLDVLLADEGLFPDEILATIAQRLGFRSTLDALIGRKP